jgi:biphenyl-2,3-diol 1,2-dioxygenase
LGLGISDPAAWRHFACEVLGMMPASSDYRLRIDSREWRIALHESSADDLVYAGFEVASSSELRDLEERIRAAGLPVKRADDDLLQARGVLELVVTEDPDGLPVELFCGLMDRGDVPFRSPAGTSAFVTGDQGLGHIVIRAPEIARFRSFYCDLLGLRISDRIKMGPVTLEFLHCNARHHTVAMIPAPLPKRLNHIMLEVATLDDVGFALDRCQAAQVPIVWSLGKHTNDQMVSFYVKSPSGFAIEYGCGGIVVDDATWRVGYYDRPSIWGHKPT